MMMPPAEQLDFDSDTLPPEQRFDRYRALYSSGADVEQAGPAPAARVRGWRLDRAILYERAMHDIIHCRGVDRVARDGFDHFTVTLVQAGRFEADGSGGAAALRLVHPGEVILFDMRQPMRSRSDHARIVTVSIARHRLAPIAELVGGLHGHVMPAEQAGLFADYVASLTRHLPTMKADAIAGATSVLGTLLIVALEARVTDADQARVGVQETRLAQLRMLVDARLSDPRFDADAAVAESGLSRATVYRLLRAQQGLAAFIRTRRLEQVRRQLSDPQDTRSFAAIAAAVGFAGEAIATHAFCDRFEMHPTDYRVTMAHADGRIDAVQQMRIWRDEVR